MIIEADDDYDPLSLPHAEEEFEEDVDEDKDEKRKESTAKTLRALVAILKRLLQSGSTDKVFTKEDVIKTAFKGTTLSDSEATVAAEIANFLNPFVPKGDALNDISVLNGVSIAKIANAIVSLIQPQQNIWKLSPSSSNSRGLPLGAVALYQILRKEYEIPCSSTQSGYITNVDQAREAKKELFRSFFDVVKMKQFLQSRGLDPYWRITYVDKWRIRILGKKTIYRTVERKSKKPPKTRKQHRGRKKRKKKQDVVREKLMKSIIPRRGTRRLNMMKTKRWKRWQRSSRKFDHSCPRKGRSIPSLNVLEQKRDELLEKEGRPGTGMHHYTRS